MVQHLRPWYCVISEWRNGCPSTTVATLPTHTRIPPPQQIGPAGSSTSVAGSLEYASPELLQSVDGVIHPSVDVWAFGVIVYSVIVGSRPFQDAFAPRIQANILSGTWDRNAVLGDNMDGHLRQDRQRWTIRDVLASPWLRDVHETAEPSPDTVWRL